LGSRSIYIIGVSDNPVKVGLADRPRTRLAQLQIGNPDPLILHHVVRVPHQVAPQVEAAAHATLASHHRIGEWFNVSAEEAREVVVKHAEALAAELRFKARQTGDIVTKLRAEYDLSDWVGEAVAFYQDRCAAASDSAKLRVAQINAHVLKRCGSASYTVWRIAIAENKSLSAEGGLWREPVIMARAEAALADALNAAAEWYAIHREQRLDRELAKRAA
jgi:nitrous oxide reductase